MELWRSCEGYEGYYEVSNLGNVRSLPRTIVRSDTGTPVNIRGCLLKPMAHRGGYLKVEFFKGSLGKGFFVHRLVAKAFIKNSQDFPQVNHKDGVKVNNTVKNLEWCDNSSNQLHAIDLGLRKMKFGSSAAAFTGTVVAYRDGEEVARLNGNKDMYEKGFDFRLVSAVLLGHRHTHKGCTFIKLDKSNS